MHGQLKSESISNGHWLASRLETLFISTRFAAKLKYLGS